MRNISVRRGLLLGALLLMASPAAAQNHGIIVPMFDGPQPLGSNVATNLNLQVWRTLRKAPYPNPKGLNFGNGIVRYNLEVFRPEASVDVSRYAAWAEVQLVMWGEVRPLGDGVVVQAFVAAPSEAALSSRPEVWKIRRDANVVSLDLPRRIFDFAPVVLDRALVQAFQTPDALRMCSAKQTPCNDFAVGADWTALKQEGNWAEIVNHPAETRGFLYLPTLDRLQNDISDFAAALLSYHRGDFGQANRLFSRVVSRESSQSSTRQDAAALAAISRARAGEDVTAAFAQLERDEPDSLYIFQAATMARLDRALRADPVARSKQLSAISSAVRANEGLFEQGDPWVRQMLAVAQP